MLKGVVGVTACESEPLARRLAEAGDHFFFRQCGQFAECADAPEREGFIVIEMEMQSADGDGCECRGFAIVRDNGDATRES